MQSRDLGRTCQGGVLISEVDSQTGSSRTSNDVIITIIIGTLQAIVVYNVVNMGMDIHLIK